MIKRLIIAVSVLLGILAYSAFAAVTIRNESRYIISLLDEIKAYSENDNMTAAEEKAAQLEKEWFSYRGRMSFMVREEKLNELNVTIAKIRPYSEEANDELEAEISNARRQLEILYREELPLAANIF